MTIEIIKYDFQRKENFPLYLKYVKTDVQIRHLKSIDFETPQCNYVNSTVFI